MATRMKIALDEVSGRVRFCAAPNEDSVRAFVWIAERRAAVLLVDMRHLNQGASVTNGAGKFMAFVQRHEVGRRGIAWSDARWFYRDSDGAFDEIVPLAFDGPYEAEVAFRPCGGRTWDDVLQALRVEGIEPGEHELLHMNRAFESADSPPARCMQSPV